MAQKLLGTLRIFSLYGAGNPQDFFSSRAPSLLKFQSLKLKDIEEKRRGGPGTPQGTGCVADSEHLGESTGSTGQVWSTNFETQPLTISCGFPAPYWAISPGGPRTLDTPVSTSAPIAEGTTDWGARGCSLEGCVTEVTGVADQYRYMILMTFY